MQNLQWFEDRLGFIILRGSTEIEISSLDMARKLHELQSTTYNFTDKLRVYWAPQAECKSCQA